MASHLGRLDLVVGVLGLAAVGGVGTPPAPMPSLAIQAPKTFRFDWTDVSGETEYRLLEKREGASEYSRVAVVAANVTSYERVVFLPEQRNAKYILQACNSAGCSDSPPVQVHGSLAAAVGFVKASNTGAGGWFGSSLALSADGSTLAVGAEREGAVYVFTGRGRSWTQQAYVKASNTGESDRFGSSVALSADGNTLAVGAVREDSAATGIGGNQRDNSASESGAVYLY